MANDDDQADCSQLHVSMKFLLLSHTRERRVKCSLNGVKLVLKDLPLPGAAGAGKVTWAQNLSPSLPSFSSSSGKLTESGRAKSIPLGLFAFFFFLLKTEVNHTLHWTLLQREMMQQWSCGTKKKGPLCKPSSPLSSHLHKVQHPCGEATQICGVWGVLPLSWDWVLNSGP